MKFLGKFTFYQPRNLPVRLGWKADPEVLLDRDRQRKGKRANAWRDQVAR